MKNHKPFSPQFPSIIKSLLNEIQNTQIVIMAGGQGKRMGLETPKPLIMLGGQTLLERCINYYKSVGFKDIIILTGYGAEKVEQLINKKYSGIKTCRDPEGPVQPPGKAKALKNALEKGIINEKKRVLITFPDDIFLDPYLPAKLLLHHLEGVKILDIWASAVFAYPVNYQFGVGKINGRGLVVKFVEKPSIRIPTSTGIYVFEPPVYNLIREIDLKEPRPVEFEERIIPELARRGKLYAYRIPGELWVPVNTQKDLKRAEKLLGISRKTG